MRERTKHTIPRQDVGEFDFEEVYRQHFDYVYRLVGRLAGESRPDDLVQEVFEVVHKRLPEFEGRAALTTWLFRISYRVVGAQIRRVRRQRLLSSWLHVNTQPILKLDGPCTLEQAELRNHLHQSVGKLSWKKRSVLVLHDVEDWSAERISKELEISINTVYSRLRAARQEMAARWTRYAETKASR